MARAVSLGLLEVSPDGGLRVPRILPLELGENQGLFKEAAEVLYRLWWEGVEPSTEEQGLEIHRLALEGKVEEIAGEIAYRLTNYWIKYSRYQEAIQICQQTIGLVADYRLLHNLANAELYLGEVEQASKDYQQALVNCPVADEEARATIIHNLGHLKSKTGDIPAALTLYEQSLKITEGIGDLQGKAKTLHEMGSLKADTGDIPAALTLWKALVTCRVRQQLYMNWEGSKPILEIFPLRSLFLKEPCNLMNALVTCRAKPLLYNV